VLRNEQSNGASVRRGANADPATVNGRDPASDPGPSTLLRTKLHVPHPRRVLVSRPRLLAQLDDGFSGPVTLIAAPPGFGKTTLLSDWIAQRKVRAAWVSLSPDDDDPARFWAYVIAALETLQAGVGEHALALLSSREAYSLETILTALINAVATFPWDFSLILDDYHVIDNPHVHSALTFLISHAPSQMHVILSTRADPPLPLAGWRARGASVEIRAADLRFTSDEASHFLSGIMGLNLARGEVVALERRTEGWIAGLQLAAMALRGQDVAYIPRFITAATSSNRYLFEYFIEEVLEAQAPGVQHFLRQTSMLERMSAPLCDAVTGRNNSQEILDYLEHAGLFVVALDAERHWFRYHPLFADVLQKVLEQADPDSEPGLHRRAALWFAEHHLVPEAITHALAASDHEQAAGLIETAGMETLGHGEVTTLLKWIAALPAELVRLRPRLSIYYASALMIAGRFEEVEPLLQEAEQSLPPAGADSETTALTSLLAAMRATLAVLFGDVSRMVDLAQFALDCLPDDPVGMTGIRSWIRGLAYVFGSQPAAASRSLSEAISASQAAGCACMAGLETYAYGLLELERGHLAQATIAHRRAMALLAERGEAETPVAGLVYLGMGELLRVQNDLAEARAYVLEGLRLAGELGNPAVLVQGYVSLAWLKQAQGDTEGALETLDEAEELAQGRVWSRSLDLLRAHRARLLLAQGDAVTPDAWAREVAPRVAQQLGSGEQLLLSQIEVMTWAQVQIMQGQPDEAMDALEVLRAGAADSGWLRLHIGSTALLALAWHTKGDSSKALTMLEEALALAEPEGHLRSFADYGLPMARLLAEGARRAPWSRPGLQSYVTRLLAAFDATGGNGIHDGSPGPESGPDRLGTELGLAQTPRAPSKHAASAHASLLADPLSDRELEVLRLLASALSNQEIADRLFVSVATVKTHAHHIYEKLGVLDRQHAALRAGELGLL
jgi:LuxR family maltose regulon positive regulatory protein